MAAYDFAPGEHEAEIVAIVRGLRELADADDITPLLKKHPRNGDGFFKKSELISGIRAFASRYGWDAERITARIRMKPVRTQSGVAPVTVLTQPFPCPGRCIFCPNDVRMPKSYLAMEPGAQRAAQHRFDPYAQTAGRLHALRTNGHRTDKVELIVLGGTWSSYPEAYQIGFVERCFRAMNAIGGLERAAAHDPRRARFDDLVREDASSTYNDVVRRRLAVIGDPIESGTWSSLEEAHRINEHAQARCVGLVLETRPDHVDEREVVRLRRLGATKIQLGVQSLDDRILSMNRRGHDVEATRSAFALLRRAGFKIHAHWMPNLYGSDPELDRQDFARLFDDPDFRPDELKIYPTSLVESADLMERHADGSYRPYAHDELVELLAECMLAVPPYCRVTRVVRDIPSHDIVAGNRRSNLREVVEASIANRGLACRDIRSREIKRDPPAMLRRRVHEYATSAGTEIFLEEVTNDDRIVAFLRLCLPDRPSFVDELGRSAIIREVHVYGTVVGIDEERTDRPQHGGLGRALIEEARSIANGRGYDRMAVISAVGTRAYYRRLGFTDGPLYQSR